MTIAKNMPTRYYRPELDVVRFLAFMMVFLHHVLPDGHDPRLAMLSRGVLNYIDAVTKACSFGLSLFFTLSAFLICELLVRECVATGTILVGRFYWRRILRIWPLYYLALSLAFILALLPGGHPRDILTMGWYVVFLGAWETALCGVFRNPVGVLWSISVEEQFYLFAPWLVRYLSRRSLALSSVALILFSNLWLVHLSNSSAGDNRVWSDTFVQFECFGAGILLCLALKGRMPCTSLLNRSILFGSAILFWFLATYFLHVRFHGGVDPGALHLVAGYGLATIGTVLIILAFLGLPAERMPSTMIYLGRISYGLYVFHEFALSCTDRLLIGHHLTLSIGNHLVRIALSGGIDLSLSLGITVLLAALSYRYFETPFLKMKKRFAVIQSQPDSSDDLAPRKDFANV